MFGYGRSSAPTWIPHPYFIDVSKRVLHPPRPRSSWPSGLSQCFLAVLKVRRITTTTVRTAECSRASSPSGASAPRSSDRVGQWLSKSEGRQLRHVHHRASAAWDSELRQHNYYFRYDTPVPPALKESEVTVATRSAGIYARCRTSADERRRGLYMHPRLVVAKKGVTGIWKDLPTPLDCPRSLAEVQLERYKGPSASLAPSTAVP